MKKFRFRLERVLQYRQTVREEAKRDLLLKNMRFFEAEAKLREFEKNLAAAAIQDEAVLSAEELYSRAEYVHGLKESIIKQKLVIIEAQQEVDKARDVYIEAAKEAKSLETLKERKKEQYRQYVEHEEEKFIDELNTQKGNTLRAED